MLSLETKKVARSATSVTCNLSLDRIRMRNRYHNLRLGPLRSHLTGMLPQQHKGTLADSISHQHPKRKGRQRRANQHQQIHRILHLPA
jgi:hypothetical protein